MDGLEEWEDVETGALAMISSSDGGQDEPRLDPDATAGARAGAGRRAEVGAGAGARARAGAGVLAGAVLAPAEVAEEVAGKGPKGGGRASASPSSAEGSLRGSRFIASMLAVSARMKWGW